MRHAAAAPLRVVMVVGNLPGLNTGKGGHYYSVKEIASELSCHFSVHVVVLGQSVPDPLVGSPGLTWIECGSMPTPRTLGRIGKMLREACPDAIHCMDSSSLLFMRMANLRRRIPICWTKCGGRPLRHYTPRGAPDIVFHREDRDLYRQRGFDPLLIPNRFRGPDRENAFTDFTTNVPPRLVRISRICEKYREGLEKTIQFHAALLEQCPGATLEIIGYPEHPDVLTRLRAMSGSSVRFLTDDETTREASRHLPRYTVAVASGRAAMEAISYGLPTLTTPTGSSAPVLVQEKNFDVLLAANFSERANTSETMHTTVRDVQFLLADPEALNIYRQWTDHVYRQHISIRSAVEHYRGLYDNLIGNGFKDSIFDLMKHLALFEVSLLLRRRRNAQTGFEA